MRKGNERLRTYYMKLARIFTSASIFGPAQRLCIQRSFLGPYSGENIAGTVQAVCQEYEIELCFVLENATNNDTYVSTVDAAHGWSLHEQKQRRLRCFRHVITLVAQALCWVKRRRHMYRHPTHTSVCLTTARSSCGSSVGLAASFTVSLSLC